MFRRIRNTVQRAALAMMSLSVFTLPAHAIDLEPLGVPICLSGTTSLFGLAGAEEVDGTPGVEYIELGQTTDLGLDDDFDGLVPAYQELRIRLRDGDGSSLWIKTLSLTSEDVAAAFSGFNSLTIGTLFDPTGFNGFSFVPVNAVCANVNVLDAGGNKVVAVTIGTVAMQGDLSGVTDLSRVNVWILEAATGNVLATHKIRPRGGRYLMALESSFADVDGDGSDEIVAAYGTLEAPVNNKQTFETLLIVFDLLTTDEEYRLKLFPSDTFSGALLP